MRFNRGSKASIDRVEPIPSTSQPPPYGVVRGRDLDTEGRDVPRSGDRAWVLKRSDGGAADENGGSYQNQRGERMKEYDEDEEKYGSGEYSYRGGEEDSGRRFRAPALDGSNRRHRGGVDYEDDGRYTHGRLGYGGIASSGRGQVHRDQFLTSAMLCVGAVSVCLVSVMIAGGLAFVGLSDSRGRESMEYMRSGGDIFQSPGAGYRTSLNGFNGNAHSLSSQTPMSRYDYFAQPDRLDQEELVEELDKRYGARLEAMMKSIQNGGNGPMLTSSMRRGEDPSYLPPAPMTEVERELNAQAELQRRLPNEKLPSAEEKHTADDKNDGDDESRTASALEEAAYAKAKSPSEIVKKARERFEEYENTEKWHEKIRQDADNYIERLSEIQAILSRGYHKSARKQIELGVEAVRQWHLTISKDLKSKTVAMKIAKVKIDAAKVEDDSVHVSSLRNDIDDELEALTKSSDRVHDLKESVEKLMKALASDVPSTGDAGAHKRRKRDDVKDDDSNLGDDGEVIALDLGSATHDHEQAMKHWKSVSDEWVDPKTGVSLQAPSLALKPGESYSVAALGSAQPTPTTEQQYEEAMPLNDVLKKIMAVVRNVTDTLGEQIKDAMNSTFMNSTFTVNTDGGVATNVTKTSVTVNFTNFDNLFNFSVSVSHGKDKDGEQDATAGVGAGVTNGFAALGMPAPQKSAELGSTWGPNEWVGTDAEDATWDPINGDKDQVELESGVKLTPTSLPGSEKQKLTSYEGEDGSTRYEYTPTPDDEDFEASSARKVAEDFAKAEHKSAEAWRIEAKKAQDKLAELAAKGVDDSVKTQKTTVAVETMDETLKEFKKALVKETKARSEAEKELRKFKIQAADDQEATEKRVVEQAKLQILAARAEARDASLARIKAEAEAEKMAKEKAELAKAAAKVQASAEKALESLMASGAEPKEDSISLEEHYEEAKDVEVEEAAQNSDVQVEEAAHKADDALDIGLPSWDAAKKDIESESEHEKDDVAAAVGDDTRSDATLKKSSPPRKFTATFGFKNTDEDDLKKRDVSTLRSALKSLYNARAPGACEDESAMTTETRNSATSLEIDVVCELKSKRSGEDAQEALNWAFESNRFAANLEKLGFTHASKIYLVQTETFGEDD